MSLIDGLRHRMYVLLRGERYADEVRRELRFHRELAALSKSGNSVGNETYYREEVRRMTLTTLLDRIRRDVSYAWRGLLRTPAFTVTVIVTLALGLGVNAAMYSFLDQVFARPPAGVVGAGHVRRLYISQPSTNARLSIRGFGSFSYKRFAGVQKGAPHADRVAAFSPSSAGRISVNGVADSARRIYVTPEYFRVLGVHPALGRFFTADERPIETPVPVAVISDRVWRDDFKRDRGVLGKSVTLGGSQVTVVGVAPPDFRGTDLNAGDIWLPLNMFPGNSYNNVPWYEGGGNYFRVIARVDDPRDEAPLLTAGAVVLRTIDVRDRRDTATTLISGPINESRGPEQLGTEVSLATRLAGVALLVLLIACANLANLLLVRATSRRREIAVRRALGVSRGQLLQQMLTESLLLGVLGALAATLFALWAGNALRHLLLPNIHWNGVAVDPRVIVYTLIAAGVVAIVAGMFPAVSATNPDLTRSLKVGATGAESRRTRVQSVLLATQCALSVVLLVGAGLIVRTFQNVRSIELGYDTDEMIVTNTYINDPAAEKALGQALPQIAERLRARPGARSIAVSTVTPMTGERFRGLYRPGETERILLPNNGPSEIAASADYFDATGTKIVAGRGFTAADRAGSEYVMVVSRQMTRELWPGENPLGKCLVIRSPDGPCARVIGVADDVRRMRIMEGISSQYYLPIAQHPDDVPESVILRAAPGYGAQLLAALRDEFSHVLPDASQYSVRTMSTVLEPQLRPWRMGAILFASLGVLALAVACVGVYGVVAYSVTQRMHEMGVRVALGAKTKDVINLVLAKGLGVAALGVAAGVVIALLLGRLIRSLLFGVVPNDASVMIGAVAVVVAFAAIACILPALRAARVDPVTALRAD